MFGVGLQVHAGPGGSAIAWSLKSADGAELAVHELDAREAAQELAATLTERTGVTPDIVQLDPVVGTHTGPGTLGVAVAPH